MVLPSFGGVFFTGNFTATNFTATWKIRTKQDTIVLFKDQIILFDTMSQVESISHYLISDDTVFPNNGVLPLLVYPQVFTPDDSALASAFETMFTAHQWPAAWRNGIFSVHHYHSTAHEVLGIYSGGAEVQFGGDTGIKLTVTTGDVVVIPAGVAHKKLRSSSDFAVVGAYPCGQYPDTCYGKKGERPRADSNVAAVALPQADPVAGNTGPLFDLWC